MYRLHMCILHVWFEKIIRHCTYKTKINLIFRKLLYKSSYLCAATELYNASKNSVLTASWYFRNIFIPSPIFFSILIPTLIFRSFKWCNWLRHKSFKSRTCTFNACRWPWLAKNKTSSQNFSLKINRLNQLITKLACLMQYWQKYKPKYWWTFRFLNWKV